MMNRNNDIGNQLEMGAVKALAAASKTPFLTAFKVTMGIAIAQLLTMILFFGGLAALGLTVLYFIARHQ